MNIKYIERPFEVKELQDDGVFEGYGSVFGNVDLGNDIVLPGAFTDSLAAWKTAGRLPPVLWQHRSGEPIGPYVEMEQRDQGLWVKGRLLVNDVQRAREAHALLKAKAINGLSIGYIMREDSYDRVTDIRSIKRADLLEVSVVTYPMNTMATVTAVKSAIDGLHSLADIEEFLRCRAGLSKGQSEQFIHRFKSLAVRPESDELGNLCAALKRNASILTVK
jgi:hypothetical protein